jgi:predicted HTH transcriptional regulator
MQDPRITKCLTAKRESKSVEFKEQFQPTDPRQSLEVLKDIVAICNSGGGTLAIGITNDGKASGLDATAVLDHDHAKYCDLIKKYTMQNYCDFEVVEAEKDGIVVAIFLINPPDAPLVFEKPGTYAVENGKQQTAFSQGAIVFRHGAKSEPGTTEDLRKFMHQRMREMQDQMLKGLRKVSEAPRGSEIQVVPRGSLDKGSSGATPIIGPVRMTTDPKAPGVFR